VVGAGAALVHYGVAILFLATGAAPQPANFAGWVCAFTVSYGGQARWTFGEPRLRRATLLRFLVTSLGAWIVNALCYQCLLAWSDLDPRLLLVVAILVAAAFTFFLARGWVFGVSAAPNAR
jgi:putative flippase GtrA